MNKAEFIDSIADAAELTKADSARALDAAIEVIKKNLKKGNTITLVGFGTFEVRKRGARSEEHTSELQSLMRISYAVFCLKKKKKTTTSQLSNQTANKQTT